MYFLLLYKNSKDFIWDFDHDCWKQKKCFLDKKCKYYFNVEGFKQSDLNCINPIDQYTVYYQTKIQKFLYEI
jgi:hypothetical protein